VSKTIDQKLGEVREWLGPGSLNFFARQFGGKDTQAGKFSTVFNAPVIGGGDILRNSEISPEIQTFLDRGNLIPSDDYERIVLPYLGQTAFQDKPLLLSSVGRLQGEENGVLAATSAAGHPVMAVPYLRITEEESFQRLSHSPGRGRTDDTEEGLRTRLAEFNEKTVPVLKTYEVKGLLVPVDGMQAADIVFNALVNELHSRAISP
jgi:adenylate kinase